MIGIKGGMDKLLRKAFASKDSKGKAIEFKVDSKGQNKPGTRNFYTHHCLAHRYILTL